MKLFLIRHGESIQNTKESYEKSIPDHLVTLTEKGKEEAKEAGLFLQEYIKNHDIDLSNSIMWVSPFIRTRETSKIINEYLNVPILKEDYLLIEQRYGLFCSKEIPQIKELYPKEFEFYDNYYHNNGKFYAILPQGESPMDVAIRTRMFLEMIKANNDNPVFIVSHGTAIKTMVMNYMHYSPEWFNLEPKPENCSIRLLENNTEQYIYNEPKILKKTIN